MNILNPNDIQTQLICDAAREEQDKYVILLIQKNMSKSISEAIKLWYSSKTKQRIQTSNIEEIRLTYPTKCYDELEKEVTGNPMWFHTPF